jgi:predicted O-methyltransferase YrrM
MEYYDFDGADVGNLVYIINSLGNNLVGAEVGCFYAQSSLCLAQKCKNVSKIYAIDSFTAYYDSLADIYFDEKDADMTKATAIHNIKFSGVADKIELIEQPEDVATSNIANKSLDFVFLDAWIDANTIVDKLERWSEKVKPNGIVSGHDWNDSRIRQIVSLYADTHNKDLQHVNNTWMWINNVS